jgi:hypothetical protein
MWKFFSRKLLVILINIGIVSLNKKLDLGLNETDILSVAGASTAYILGQSYQDAKQGPVAK